jgi:hypothetical protein
MVAGLSLTAGSSALFAQDRVGVNSAVNPEATGAVPGAAARQLVIGQDVIFNEHITTTAAGQTQLLFLDESSMTVGPNSDLTIDQFVYDPKSGTGKLAMSATRGLLRYVGGKLSKQDDAVTLRTATATLAVRGGAYVAEVHPDGKTDAGFLYGKGLTVTGVAGGSQTITRPGWQSIVLPGGLPSRPAPMPPGLLALYTQLLDGRTGGRGGAPVIPTDTSVADSGVGQTISGNLTQSFQQAGQNQGGNQGTGTTTTLSPGTTTVNTLGSTTNGVATTTSTTTPTGPQPVTITTTGPYAGVSKTNVKGGFSAPDQTSSSNNVPFGSGALSNGTFGAIVGGSVLSFPLATGTSTFGPTGSSAGGMVSGTSFLSNDGSFFYANLNAANGRSFFVSGGLVVPSSALASTGSTRIFAFSLSGAPSPSNIPFSVSDDATFTKPSLTPLYVVAPASTAIGDTSTTSTSGTTIAARELQATVAFSGTGSAQNSTAIVQIGAVGTLNGAPFIKGTVRGVESEGSFSSETITSPISSVVDKNGNSLYGTNTITGFTLDQTKYATTASTTSVVVTGLDPLQPQASETEGISTVPSTETYGFAQPAVAMAVPAGVGTNRTTQTLTGYFGGMMTTSAISTPYAITGAASIATDNTANTVKATFTSDTLNSSATGGVTAITMNFGGQNSVFVDDNIFGATEDKATPQQINGKQLTVAGDTTQGGQLYLVSSATAALPTSLLPSGASFCQCQFLQWGYWGGDLLTGNVTNDLISRVDHGHINFWVAGVPTSVGDLNTLTSQSATGIYTGAAIGSVYNGATASNYVAAGGFLGTYNFGPQTGTLTISNFDGNSFSTGTKPVKLPLTGANYTFTLAPTATAPIAGTINGSFFGPKAAETGGNFAVHTTLGPTYIASGIFAGKQ